MRPCPHKILRRLRAVDSRHLLLLGTGPGLGASVARRFAREAYRLTLVARSQATTAALADELRGEGIDVTVVVADVGDPDRLRAAVAPLFAATLSLGKLALRGVATMLARQVRDDGIHAGSLTTSGRSQRAPRSTRTGSPDAYSTIRNEEPDAWREEYRFDGALETTRPTAPATSRAD